ncbi:MAG: DNA/RNA nuclease SfsA [Saccharospirillaceae bacterium]|nr:DNA/RNA nuclease SfsA [Saccharospirillaceae bacterium]MCD8530609.1 DNA/RNA nuclease SfsA [Saccharospirillaceae bacterium]
MRYDAPLVGGRLIKRYKRFLADIVLDSGEEITAHCPNTGSMKHCAEPGSRVWLWDSLPSGAAAKRKYRYSWEWVEIAGRYKACINTARPNQLVAEALAAGRIAELAGEYQIQPEPRVADGRLDFLLQVPQPHERSVYVEVKSVTLLDHPDTDDGWGSFPDAVTVRGLKHLRRLAGLRQQGYRSVLLFCVPHEGIERVRPARVIDPAYAAALADVVEQGVEVLAYQARFDAGGLELGQRLPVDIG